jgi:hypothetical protein
MLSEVLIARENWWLAVCIGLLASVAVTVTWNVPVDAGVPEMAPVSELMVSDEGSPVADQAYGVVPPEAATVLL